MLLSELGFSAFFQESFAKISEQECEPARVLSSSGVYARLGSDGEEFIASVPRNLRLVTGDWVAFHPKTATVLQCLPRRTEIVRQRAGRRTAQQVLSANVDVIFIVTGLDGDFNPRRLERYLVLAYQSGAKPVVLLTKASLCNNVAEKLLEAQKIAQETPCHAIDVISGINSEIPWEYLSVGTTVVLLGSSGVGKSTLLNTLVGKEVALTGEVRRGDKKGRHTTTTRELHVLERGGLLIDTPGLRELQLWADETDIDEAFGDIEQYSTLCQFRDCKHLHEPGCAVQEAIKNGSLDPDRLGSRNALHQEVSLHVQRRAAVEMAAYEKQLGRAQKNLLKLKRR